MYVFFNFIWERMCTLFTGHPVRTCGTSIRPLYYLDPLRGQQLLRGPPSPVGRPPVVGEELGRVVRAPVQVGDHPGEKVKAY